MIIKFAFLAALLACSKQPEIRLSTSTLDDTSKNTCYLGNAIKGEDLLKSEIPKCKEEMYIVDSLVVANKDLSNVSIYNCNIDLKHTKNNFYLLGKNKFVELELKKLRIGRTYPDKDKINNSCKHLIYSISQEDSEALLLEQIKVDTFMRSDYEYIENYMSINRDKLPSRVIDNLNKIIANSNKFKLLDSKHKLSIGKEISNPNEEIEPAIKKLGSSIPFCGEYFKLGPFYILSCNNVFELKHSKNTHTRIILYKNQIVGIDRRAQYEKRSNSLGYVKYEYLAKIKYNNTNYHIIFLNNEYFSVFQYKEKWYRSKLETSEKVYGKN